MPQTATMPFSAMSLSEQDVLRLLEDHSTDTLADISGRIAGGYGNSALKPSESQAAEQIFRLLLRETETRIRVNLANTLKSSALPKDIVLTMARDVEEVALPVLQYSQVLTDEDLTAIIHAIPSTAHHLAIAQREQISQFVTDSLLATNNESVADTLVNNAGADLSETGMSRIVEQFPENKVLISALVNRSGVTATLAERMVSLVSDSLAKTLKTKYNLPDLHIAQEVEKTRESETLTILRNTQDQEQVSQLVAQLIAGKRLSPSLVVSSLCQGNLLFFETALAKLADVSPTNARALINDRGDLGFRAIYNKSGLPSTMFPAIRLLLRVVQDLSAENIKPATPHYTNRVAERVLAYGEKNPVENLSYIIALIRRGA